jgi:outer membrane immunogenic protein
MRNILLSAVSIAALTTSALAADLPSGKEAPVYSAPAPAFSWTGFYIGGDIGGSFASSRVDPILGVNHYSWIGQSLNSSGFMGGGYLGYNFQLNQSVVLGLEGDFQGTANSKSMTWKDSKNDVFFRGKGGTYSAGANMGWLGAINGRLGVANDRALFYAIGGVAWADASSSLDWTRNSHWASSSASKTLSGFDVGAGVEYAFTPNWVGRVEYRYYGFSSSYDLNPSTSDWNNNELAPGRIMPTSVNTVRVGLGYLFSSPAPVVAKY